MFFWFLFLQQLLASVSGIPRKGGEGRKGKKGGREGGREGGRGSIWGI